MAEARETMMKQYGQNFTQHPDKNEVEYKQARYNNNVRSQVMNTCGDPSVALRKQKKREAHFQEHPLRSQASRASYQDSNIFGVKADSASTVQVSATVQPKDIRVRESNTIRSNVLKSDQNGPSTADMPTRTSNTFSSNTFGAPIVQNSGRKNLGGKSSGTETLFGTHQTDFQRSSQQIVVSSASTNTPKTKTDFTQNQKFQGMEQVTADQRKAQELYGASAQKFGTKQNKKDGALMCSGADWKNAGQQATNMASPYKKGNLDNGFNTKDRKYQHLSSNVFGDDTSANKPVYDSTSGRAAMKSNADWSFSQTKPVNRNFKVDTYTERKKQLASNIFDNQTDYHVYAPQSKRDAK